MTGTIAAQHDQSPQNATRTVGQDVMLTACVDKGIKDGTFVLTHVADVPVHQAPHGRVVYWLDKRDELKQHVGHQIRVSGKIIDVKQGNIEIKPGASEDGGWYVEIEGPGKDVRTTPSRAGVAAERSGGGSLSTTLVRVKVGEVLAVAASCPVK